MSESDIVKLAVAALSVIREIIKKIPMNKKHEQEYKKPKPVRRKKALI